MLSNTTEIIYKPSLSKVLKRTITHSWSYLAVVLFGTSSTVLLSISLMFIIALIFKIAFPQASYAFVAISLIPVYFVYWICSVGVNYYVHGIVNYEHTEIIDIWLGIKKLFKPASQLFVVSFLILTILFIDAAFFVRLAGNGQILFMVLAIFMLYLFLYWISISLYFIPVMIYQDKLHSNVSPFIIIKKSYLLAADNQLFTLGVFLSLIILLPGFALLFLGISAFLTNTAARELYLKYNIVEEPKIDDNNKWRVPEK